MQHGDSFDVLLGEPAATGHRWRLVKAPAEVALIDERYDRPAPGRVMGGAGQRIISLRATRRGHYRLKFELIRPWETQPAAEHYVDVDAL